MGKSFAAIGPEHEKYHKLDYIKAVQEDRVLKGQIVSIDAFGNLITNIDEKTLLSFAGEKKLEILFGPERFDSISKRYSDVKKNAPLVIIGSSGFLEISMNESNAAKYFMTSIGSPVTIRKY